MLRARIQKMNLERAEEFAAERNPRAILPNEKMRGQGSLAWAARLASLRVEIHR